MTSSSPPAVPSKPTLWEWLVWTIPKSANEPQPFQTHREVSECEWVTMCLELSVIRNIRPSTPWCTISTGTHSFPASSGSLWITVKFWQVCCVSLCESISDSWLTLFTSLLSAHLLGSVKCLNSLAVDSAFSEFQHCLRKTVSVQFIRSTQLKLI